ncbi:hypothetical protein BHX94_12300 (plasmid) [Macrococcoides bohemicum]|uniref:Uncharacterized protein n=1 Tax=Macrococcoides bohemicum TaxID=1903056 RepID=A0A328A0N0_9STAP|nr:hypothetical protein [Macrococcus bohemicus]RAK47856.1 hypothetical protein BHX94_12300 [Macrococcus bohemicus]
MSLNITDNRDIEIMEKIFKNDLTTGKDYADIKNHNILIEGIGNKEISKGINCFNISFTANKNLYNYNIMSHDTPKKFLKNINQNMTVKSLTDLDTRKGILNLKFELPLKKIKESDLEISNIKSLDDYKNLINKADHKSLNI